MTTRFHAALLWALAVTCPAALAGPGEDASAVVDRWSAAYSANDTEALVKLYSADAVLLGTMSPVISEGTAAIQSYFGRLKGSGNQNAIKERRVIVLGDDAAVVTGFYDFSNAQQTPALRPSRFTMLVTRRGGEWKISHHHSSPLAPPPK
jgi:uncharacterized protein (TIGR02246 family)